MRPAKVRFIPNPSPFEGGCGQLPTLNQDTNETWPNLSALYLVI